MASENIAQRTFALQLRPVARNQELLQDAVGHADDAHILLSRHCVMNRRFRRHNRWEVIPMLEKGFVFIQTPKNPRNTITTLRDNPPVHPPVHPPDHPPVHSTYTSYVHVFDALISELDIYDIQETANRVLESSDILNQNIETMYERWIFTVSDLLKVKILSRSNEFHLRFQFYNNFQLYLADKSMRLKLKLKMVDPSSVEAQALKTIRAETVLASESIHRQKKMEKSVFETNRFNEEAQNQKLDMWKLFVATVALEVILFGLSFLKDWLTAEW